MSNQFMNIEQLHKLYLSSNSVCTDTRHINKDCMFFGLKGDNFNGNEFAKLALENGAKYAIIDEVAYNVDDRYILVKDVLSTLQALAKYHRQYLGIKIIALTGSNGKTTSKELINVVLSKKFNVVATKGNLNNHIGVPLTLLSMDNTTEIGIVEMGANHKKEIDFLCGIARPDYGYITNFGKAHLEGFGGIEGVIEGKSELYDFLISNGKHIFINADDAIQIKKLENYSHKIGFSEVLSDYYQIKFIEATPFVTLSINDFTINSNLIGAYNFTNLCAAVSIGMYFNVSLTEIKSSIEAYTPQNNRSQIIKKGSNKIILDAYNANPSSMKAALDNFNQLNADNKISILGDMFELGIEAEKEHQLINNYVSNMNISMRILVGKNFANTKSNNALVFSTFNALRTHLQNTTITKSTILIKGSRGMALERVLELL